MSIGVTRILGLLFGAGALTASRSVPTCVLVALPAEESRPECDRIARVLRARGIATEVAPAAAKYGKQIRFAERRGIPYVWFPGADSAGGAGDGTGDEVKDIRSGAQVAADAATWEPAPEDLRPQVIEGSAS
jgi:histidyl-tRNA synthetase